VQEPQFSPFEADTLTPAEQQALKQARGRRLRALLLGVGTASLTLFAVGCPEPGDLQNPGAYQAPTPTAGTASAGTASGGSTTTGGGAECEVACLATAFTPCFACHGTAMLVPKLDLKKPGYTALLKNQPAQYTGVPAAMCPSPPVKLIDTAAPANSWLLKKVKNDVGTCGTPMPPPGSGEITPADVKCVEDYVACVTGTAPAATGGTGTAGTASGGTATGGTGGT
jgi:hypothetical protein